MLVLEQSKQMPLRFKREEIESKDRSISLRLASNSYVGTRTVQANASKFSYTIVFHKSIWFPILLGSIAFESNKAAKVDLMRNRSGVLANWVWLQQSSQAASKVGRKTQARRWSRSSLTLVALLASNSPGFRQLATNCQMIQASVQLIKEFIIWNPT